MYRSDGFRLFPVDNASIGKTYLVEQVAFRLVDADVCQSAAFTEHIVSDFYNAGTV